MRKTYDLRLEKFDNTVEHIPFASRKQAFVFIYANMFAKDTYRYARLLDETTGEIWLEINWRGRDNYRRKRV